MEVFTYLENDNASIADRLTAVAKNYSEWTQERVFEEIKKAFASIQGHFSTESILENNIKNSNASQTILSEILLFKKEINDEIEQIVEIHVDEPGFEQSLETIAAKFNQYAQLCKEKFYPALQKHLSAEELKHINEQMEEKVLS